MSCLNERRLLLLHTDEGTAADRTHLGVCADCAERYDALVEDLALIGTALQSPPPRMPASARPFSARTTRLAFGGVGVTIAAVVLIGGWLSRPSPVVQVATASPNITAFATELSVAVFETDDVENASEIVPDVAAVRTALSGRYPCTTAQALNAECDDELSALLSQPMD